MTPSPLVRPIDMSARYGDGVQVGLSLGGGGVWFVAWQVAYLFELSRRGVDLAGADRVVGTSAGSVVASVLEAGNLGRMHAELRVLARVPKVVGALAPAGSLSPSQERARDLFGAAPDATPERIREIGHAALAATTPPPQVMSRNVSVILASRGWPSEALHVTCVDAYSGERCVVTRGSRVPLSRAVAASSAVPGLFAPQPIQDRRCMDGGVSGTGTHLDLLSGARRAVVLGLTDGADVEEGRMTVAPGSTVRELEELRSTGTEVLFRMPETVDIDRLMDPTAVPDAIDMARRQAAADTEHLRAFLA
jgi:NTE family protein